MPTGATLPPLFDFPSSEHRAKTAPAGTVNSARRAQSSREGYRPRGYRAPPKSAGNSPRKRPVPHVAASDPSPPSTAKSTSITLVPAFPNKATADVMQMVHGYWAPVEEAVRSRHPIKLEIALRDLHGSEYLRTIYSVRRSAALKASERNAIEMELAARLVRARAVLGKWQGGMREILEAHQSRDADRLEKSLAKWSFTGDVPEIAEAKENLGRWRDLADTLPLVLKDAVEKVDVPQLRKAVAELDSIGPNGVEGACGARKILNRYNAQAKVIDDAIAARNSRSIREAMAAWSFDRDDPHIDAALAALQRFEEQKAALRSAIDSLEGVALQKAVDEWSFERDAAPFIEATLALNRYMQASRHLNELAQAPELSIHQLADEINTWEFTQDDPVLGNVRGVLGAFEDAIREAIDASDGWMLENLCSSGNDKKEFMASPDLRSQVTDMLRSYQACVADLQEELRGAEDLKAAAAPRIAALVREWSFASNDPYLEIAQHWLRLHRLVRTRNIDVLRRVVNAGDVFSMRRLIPAVRGSIGDCPELRAAEEACRMFDEAVNVVGAVALGVEPQHLKGALQRTARLNECIQTIHRTVESIEFKWVACLKAMTKPPPIVHAVFQMVVHVLAGINPQIKDPPRDTEWRSCQKMMLNTSAFLSNLKSVPDYIASGRTTGIERARTLALSFHLEYQDTWSLAGIAATNECASKLYSFLVHILNYTDILDSKEECSEVAYSSTASSPARSRFVSSSSMRSLLSEKELPYESDFAPPTKVSLVADDTGLRQSKRMSAVETVHSRRSHVIRAKSLSKPLYSSSLPLTDQFHPLMVLQRAKRTLTLSPVLSLAWILSGRDVGELNACSRRMQTYACGGEAAKAVSSQLVSHFVPPEICKDASKDRETVKEKQDLWGVPLTVELISGEVVANFQVDSATTVAELKQRLQAIEGTPAQQQQLMFREKKLSDGMTLDVAAIANGSPLTLIRLAPNLPQLLENAFYSCCSTRSLASAKARDGMRGDLWGAWTRSRDETTCDRPVTSVSSRDGTFAERLGSGRSQDDSLGDPVAYLLFGNATDKLTARSRKGNIQSEIAKMLRAAKESIQTTSRIEEPSVSDEIHLDLNLHTTPIAMDQEVVKISKIPVYNLVFAKRFSTDGVNPAVDSLIAAMECYYDEYVPLRAAWLQAAALREDSQHALRESERVLSLTSSMGDVVKIPTGSDVAGVKKVAVQVTNQVEQLARKGIALPAMHVELVRQAIDAAGLHLLSNPPAADPGARIRWSETAMAIQLTPLSHFSIALKGIARSMSKQDLSCFHVRNEMPSTEFVRLVGAVMWVIQPECTSNPTWAEVKLVLADPLKFVEKLQSWTPISDASLSRLTRARSVLLGIWPWVANGCSGDLTLCVLFAWVSLAVAIAPLVDMTQRLTPVYKSVKQGIAKSQLAPANRKKLATARAWNAALFLLDGPGEHWWWLKLIRPAASMDRPWTDGEDGGVGESHIHEHGADNHARHSDSKDSLQEDSLGKLVNQTLLADEPVDEDVEESGEDELTEPDELNEEPDELKEEAPIEEQRVVESPDAPESLDRSLTNDDVDLAPSASPTPTGELERQLTPSSNLEHQLTPSSNPQRQLTPSSNAPSDVAESVVMPIAEV